MVLCDFLMWCNDKQITPVITDTVSTLDEDIALNRTSSTHRESRAFDISTKGWDRELISDCSRVFNAKYRYLAAIDSIGNPRLVYFHNAGTGEHLHFQVNKKFAINS